MRTGLVAVVVVLGCGGGGEKHIELTLTTAAGVRSTQTLSDDTGFLFEGGTATVSWPDLGTWNNKVPLGVSMAFHPLLPGRFERGGFLHQGADSVAKAKSVSWKISLDRVRWQNEPGFPFRMEGSAEGTTAEGDTLSGRFSTTTDDCSDKVKSNGNAWLCGLPFPQKTYPEQKWAVASWQVGESCPAGLLERYGGGTELSLTSTQAKAGGTKSLQCVITYQNAYRVVCGASEEGLVLDGCTWSVAAVALPGAVPYEVGHLNIFAGTTDTTCAPKVCEIFASGVTHLSGAMSGP